MASYLIIFGAAVRADGTPSGSLLRRVEGALAAAPSYPEPRFLVTGGLGRHGPAEAIVMRDLLMAKGVASKNILLETQAKDTLESIRFCGIILASLSDVALLVPCTSRYHLPRCAILLRLLGYPVARPHMPADRPHLGTRKWLSYALKEFLALPYDVMLLLAHRVWQPAITGGLHSMLKAKMLKYLLGGAAVLLVAVLLLYYLPLPVDPLVRLAELAERTCLSNTDDSRIADVKVKLNFIKGLDGGASAETRNKAALGASEALDSAVRAIENDKIRDCMAPWAAQMREQAAKR
jgi:uncharacterized SAM-binding protein YcdF (DUF218 family)